MAVTQLTPAGTKERVAEPAHSATSLRELVSVPDRAPRRGADSRGFVLRRLLLLADTAALTVAFLCVEAIGGFDGGAGKSLGFDLALLAVAIPVWVLFARVHNLYHVDSRRADHGISEELAPILQMTTLWSWSLLLLVSATGIRSLPLSKLVIFWLLTIGLLLLFRSGTRAWSRRQVWYVQNALVVGAPTEAGAVIKKFLRHPEYKVNVVAGVDLIGENRTGSGAGLRSPDTHATRSFGPVPLIRGEVDVLEIVRELDVDRVVLGPSVDSLSEYSDLLSELAELDVHVDLIPGWAEVVGARLELHELEGMPLLTVPYVKLARSSLWCKRLLDVAVSGLALIVLAPLFALCALAIKLNSRGPVFFKQRRVGKGDCHFELFKFRSMYVDAEERKDEVAELSFHGGGNDGGMFKIEGDPRVTRIGRMLRRTSLDELPQLINILRGHMSLVGPRPLIDNEDRQIEGRFRRRVDLTPGLTGLWQVHGRSDIPFEDMIDLDYLYATNWSLWTDVKLLLKTFAAVTRGQGAY